MSIDMEAAATWSPEKLFQEFVDRHDVLGQLVGALYTSIVSDEMAAIEQICMNRYGCATAWLIDQHIITASRTDEFGVVHDVIRPCDSHFRGMRISKHLDVPAKPLTCLVCVGA